MKDIEEIDDEKPLLVQELDGYSRATSTARITGNAWLTAGAPPFATEYQEVIL